MSRKTLTISLPHSIEAEKAVLGALMLDATLIREVTGLTGEDFYREAHGNLFNLLVFMADRGDPIDTAAVCERIHEGARRPVGADPGNGVVAPLSGGDASELYGGLWFVSDLADNVPSSENIDYYVRQVRELADRRALVQGMDQTRAEVSRGNVNAAQARETLLDLACQGSIGPHSAPVSALLADQDADLVAEMNGEREVYIPTGIISLDTAHDFGGITTEGMTYLIGASGMGKTSLLNRLALGMAVGGRHIYLYGTETGMKRRTRDLTFSLAGVDARAWAHVTRRRGAALRGGYDTTPMDRVIFPLLEKLRAAQYLLDRLPIIVNNAGRTVEQVCRQIRQYNRQGRCDVAIVDYLQDFACSPGVDPGRSAQVSHASKQLKELAAKLEIPLIVGAQRQGEMELNNALASVTDRGWPGVSGRLVPAQIQWCSGAYQDAEEVYGMYRRDYYADRHAALEHLLPGPPGQIEIHAKKRRSGPLTTWGVDFNGPTKWAGGRPPALTTITALREAGK